MYAVPAFGNGSFQPLPPAAPAFAPPPPPMMGQQQEKPPAEGGAEKQPSRTGSELTVIIVLGIAVLAGLEAAGVTNILGRKPSKRGDTVWTPR